MKKKQATAATEDAPLCLDALWVKFADSFDRYAEVLPCTRILNNIRREHILDCPNLLLYSAAGVPIDLVWVSLIQRMFQVKLNTIEKTYDKEVIYTESPYHFHIDIALPYQTTSLTKLTGFIKDIIVHRCIEQGCRHVMVISSIDKLLESNYGSSQAFRMLLEKFSVNVLFICTVSSISSVEKPIQSRFMAIRVPAFTNDQINDILEDLGLPQLINIDTHACSRNVAFCIYMSYLLKTGRDVDSMRYPIIRDILQPPSSSRPSLDSIRTLAATLHAYNASLADIANDLTLIYYDMAAEIVSLAAAIDHKLAQTDCIRKSLYIEHLLTTVAVKKNSVG